MSLECKFCNKKCINPNSLRNHERLCKLNPNRQTTCMENPEWHAKYRVTQKGKSPWNKGLTKQTDARVAKGCETLRKHLNDGSVIIKGHKHTEEAKQKISKAATLNNIKRAGTKAGRGKRGYYKGYYCQSSWELAYVIYNLDHNINFIRNKKYFNYIYEDKQRHYFPDFYLPDIDTYIEVKGYYDKLSKVKVEQFQGNLKVLQQSEMQPYLDYVVDKYGKDFYKLYDIAE